MTIFRNVAYLSEFGHRNTIYCADFEGKFKTCEELEGFIHQNFVDTKAHVLRNWNLQPCDVAIATHWSTAYPVHDFPDCSKRFYFVQDYEPYFHAMSPDYLRAENSYRLGFSCVTIGRWLTDKLREDFDADAEYFDFAVDSRTYYLRNDTPRNMSVAFCAQPEKPRRCFDLGAKALEIVARRCPEVDIVFFGSNTEPTFPIKYGHRNLGVISPEECAKLYSSSAVGLILSASNPSLIGFEMMACGCAVVDLDRENNWFDYDPTAVSLADATPEGLAEAILVLLGDENKRTNQAQCALEIISKRTYEETARKVEALILRGWITGRVNPAGRRVLDEFQSLGEESAALGSPFTQTFLCVHSNLCRIDVFFANKGQNNAGNAVVFELSDLEDERRVATVAASIKDIQDWAWHSFVVPVQPFSRGRSYRVKLWCEGGCSECPRVVYTRRRAYASGELTLGGELIEGALKFKTYCAVDDVRTNARMAGSRQIFPSFPTQPLVEISDYPLGLGDGSIGAVEVVQSEWGGSRVPQGETLLIKGWFSDRLAGAPERCINVEIDGVMVGRASLGGPLRGIRSSSAEAATSLGWSFVFDTSSLALGLHTVTAVALDRGGGRVQLGENKTVEITAEPTREPFSSIMRMLRNVDRHIDISRKNTTSTLRDVVTALEGSKPWIFIWPAKFLIRMGHYWVRARIHFQRGGLKAVFDAARDRIRRGLRSSHPA